MRRVLVPALLLTLFAAAPATVHAATDFTGTYSATDSRLTIYLQNTGDTTIRWWAFRLEGGAGLAEPLDMSADRPGNFTPYGPYNFDFYPDTATARPAIAAGGSLVIQVATNGLVTKLVSSATDTRPEDGGMLPQDKEIPRGGPPSPPAKDDPPAPPPPEEDPEELGDGECVLRSARLGVRSLRSQHPCPTTSPPAVEDCRCADFTVSSRNVRMQLVENVYVLSFGLDWDLDCSEAQGTGCQGSFKVVPPSQPRAAQGLAFQLKNPKKTITCKSNGTECKDRTGSEPVRLRIANNKNVRNPIGTLLKRLGKNPDSGKPQTLVFTVERKCGDQKLKSFTMKVAFDKKGHLDKKKSDLNSNGKPDGTERTG